MRGCDSIQFPGPEWAKKWHWLFPVKNKTIVDLISKMNNAGIYTSGMSLEP